MGEAHRHLGGGRKWGAEKWPSIVTSITELFCPYLGSLWDHPLQGQVWANLDACAAGTRDVLDIDGEKISYTIKT